MIYPDSNLSKENPATSSNITSDNKHNFISLLPPYIVYIQQIHSYEGITENMFHQLIK